MYVFAAKALEMDVYLEQNGYRPINLVSILFFAAKHLRFLHKPSDAGTRPQITYPTRVHFYPHFDRPTTYLREKEKCTHSGIKSTRTSG